MRALFTTRKPTPQPSLTLEALIALGPISPRVAKNAQDLAELIEAVEVGLLMESGVYEIMDFAAAA
jgi:hypothetical protein